MPSARVEHATMLPPYSITGGLPQNTTNSFATNWIYQSHYSQVLVEDQHDLLDQHVQELVEDLIDLLGIDENLQMLN